MEMICPDCNLVVDFDRLPMRLQTCKECAKDGSSSYLIVTPRATPADSRGAADRARGQVPPGGRGAAGDLSLAAELS